MKISGLGVNRFIPICGLVLAFLTPAFGNSTATLPTRLASPAAAPATLTAATRPAPVLPAGLLPVLARTLAAQSPQTWRAKRTAGDVLAFNNPAQHFFASFNRQGIRLQFDGTRHGQMRMQLLALHSGAARFPVAAGKPSVHGVRVQIGRGHGLSEWYVNSQLGLEQGFTLDHPFNTSHLVVLSFRVHSALKPVPKNNGLEFQDAHGNPVLRYGDLLAFDADHHPLPADMQFAESRLELTVDTRGARYPIRIDPLFSAITTFNDPPADSGDFFGYSADLSSDGSTLLVGAQSATVNGVTQAGAVYFYSRTNSIWSTTPTIKIPDPSATFNDGFGTSVALSADGKTALVGAPGDTVAGNQQEGQVYIYTFSATSSSAQILGDPNGTANDNYGHSVALSADGKTALISAWTATIGGHTSQGVAYLYVQSNGTWSNVPTQVFTDPSATAFDQFGSSVVLAANGDSALIGAPGTVFGGNGFVGAAYVYTQTGGAWSGTPAHTFTDPPGKLSDSFGVSGALSADGGSALIGASGTTVGGNGFAGAAYIYTQSNGQWPSTPTQSFTDPLAGASDFFGSGVALPADGSSALIGAYGSTVSGKSTVGAAYGYTSNNGAWPSTPTHDFADPLGVTNDSFGTSVALSTDGGSAFIGAVGTPVSGNNAAGAGYLIASTADLSLALSSSPASVMVGGSVTYMVTITNSDTQVTATSLSLTDTLPAGMTYVSSSAAGGSCANSGGTVTCTLASLAPQATWQPSIAVTATAAGSIQDTATVSASQPDPNTANNSASVTTSVTAPPPPPPSSSGGGGGALGSLSLLLIGLFALLSPKRCNQQITHDD